MWTSSLQGCNWRHEHENIAIAIAIAVAGQEDRNAQSASAGGRKLAVAAHTCSLCGIIRCVGASNLASRKPSCWSLGRPWPPRQAWRMTAASERSQFGRHEYLQSTRVPVPSTSRLAGHPRPATWWPRRPWMNGLARTQGWKQKQNVDHDLPLGL